MRRSGPSRISFSALALFVGWVTACDKDSSKTADKGSGPSGQAKTVEKPSAATKPAPPELRPEAKPLDLSGPKPPEVSSIMFVVDGALIPIGCYDQTKDKLLGGPACGQLLGSDEVVYLSSEYGKELDTIGATKNALCELANKPTSFSTPILDGGKAYDWALWPKSSASGVVPVPVDTTSDTGSALSDEEIKATTEFMTSLKPSAARGNFRGRQRAQVDVNGDGSQDLFISALLADPKDDERNLYSGLFMAPGGDLNKLLLIDSSKRGSDVITLRGLVDLNGDGESELWLGLSFEGGAADRIVTLHASKVGDLAKWTCGA